MRRNNTWNRLFHKAEVKENQKQHDIYLKQCLEGQRILDALEDCKSLITLVSIHKDAWGTGFQNENLGPCPHGYIRTTDIPTMTPDQIYLGNRWGLTTHNIPFWEEHKGEKYGANGFGLDPELDLYEMILNQYKGFLTSNIRSMFNKARVHYPEYKRLGY